MADILKSIKVKSNALQIIMSKTFNFGINVVVLGM